MQSDKSDLPTSVLSLVSGFGLTGVAQCLLLLSRWVDLPCYASIPYIESTQPICNVVLGSVVRMVTESELLRTQTCNHKSHNAFLCNKKQRQNPLCALVDVLEGEILVTSVLWGWTASLSLRPVGEIVTWAPVCCNLNLHVAQMSPAT